MTPPDFSLIETFRYEPETGFVRLDLHRARLARSAEALGFLLEEDAVGRVLSTLPRDHGRLRVRLELSADGTLHLTHTAFTPLDPDAVWRVAIARTRLSSADPLLAHKTSRRDIYAAARAEFPAGEVDEVLLGNEKGEICEGTITSVFATTEPGQLLTPPLQSGLLDGVLRQSLISTGKARTGVLYPEDLAGKTFYAGNSLRGLIACRLVSP
nr:aminotransferase class IV family protein [uncultured Gellertiella sp.]